jgi:hypothetical protein
MLQADSQAMAACRQRSKPLTVVVGLCHFLQQQQQQQQLLLASEAVE